MTTVQTNNNTNDTLIISSAEEMNPSRRNTMEDCHVIHPAGTWGCNDPDMTYVAVYDGHGGKCDCLYNYVYHPF